jgi:hypothetical protein
VGSEHIKVRDCLIAPSLVPPSDNFLGAGWRLARKTTKNQTPGRKRRCPWVDGGGVCPLRGGSICG